MNRIHPELNPLEVLLVCQHYEQRGIAHYTLTKGNDCIWAYRGQFNEYFIFRDGAIVEIQID
jgi:hypothetical protein